MAASVIIKDKATGVYEIVITPERPIKPTEWRAFEYTLEEFVRSWFISRTEAEQEEYTDCPRQGHWFHMNRDCGAYVCMDCTHHRGLVRCHCGWARDGGDGRQQLRDLGETIEEEG